MRRRSVIKAERRREFRSEGQYGILAVRFFAGMVFVSGIMAAALAGTGWRIGADFQERTCIGRVFLFRKNDVLENLAASPGDFRNSLLAVELSGDWQGFRKGTLLIKEAGAVSGDLVRFSEKGLCLAAAGSENSGACRLLPGIPAKWRRIFSNGFFQGRSSGFGPQAASPGTAKGLLCKTFRIPENTVFLNGSREDSLDSRILGPFPLSRASAVYRAVRLF